MPRLNHAGFWAITCVDIRYLAALQVMLCFVLCCMSGSSRLAAASGARERVAVRVMSDSLYSFCSFKQQLSLLLLLLLYEYTVGRLRIGSQ